MIPGRQWRAVAEQSNQDRNGSSSRSQRQLAENSYAQPVRGDVIEFVESQRRSINIPFGVGSEKLTPQAHQLLKAIAAV